MVFFFYIVLAVPYTGVQVQLGIEESNPRTEIDTTRQHGVQQLQVFLHLKVSSHLVQSNVQV